MTENAQALKLYAETSDAPIYQAMHTSINTLLIHMNRVAKDLAKSRDGWMDDPDDEDYAAWHANADEQFTTIDRLEVLRAMLSHQIDELLIQEEWRELTASQTRTITSITVFWDDAPRFGGVISSDLRADAGWAFRAEGSDIHDEPEYGVIAGCEDDDLDGAIDEACRILDLDLTHDDFGREPNRDGGCGTWMAE